MRLLLTLLLSVPLLAQDAAPKPQETPKAEEKQAEAKTGDQAAAPAAQAPAPAPAGEPWLTGSIDFGYRFREVGGNINTYRSVVDYGHGPRLFGWDFTIQDPKKRWFDRIDTRGNDWGGEPYNTASVDARKMGVYEFRFDYRNIAYFNNLPSFADPLSQTEGVFLDERSYDTRYRFSDFQLDLLPGKRIVPYLAYSRQSFFGTGVTTFVAQSNEYPVFNNLSDSMDNYRGGVRFGFDHLHMTLEQGGTTFRDDQRVGYTGQSTGNFTGLFLQRQLLLNNALEAYAVSGQGIYTKATLNANPVSWADLFGEFLYSQPKNDITYNQTNQGNFVDLATATFFNSQQQALSGEVKQPHVSANVGGEVRPLRRLRIIESWMTDRYHDASNALVAGQMVFFGPVTATTNPITDRLFVNYNQQQLDVLYDVIPKVTLRGGWRYVWGDAGVRPPSLLPITGLEQADLHRQVGLAGVTYRSGGKLSASLDFEGADSDNTYFRTSLHNYQLVRARARYQVLNSLSLGANFYYLNNNNPIPGIGYDYHSQDISASFAWTPNSGKRVSVLGEYTRSALKSDISYLEPEFLTPERSLYRDNAHTGNAIADFALPGYSGLTPRIGLGGAFFISNGSRPTSYYQPLARLSVPFNKHVYWNSEWRWYGFGESFYIFEGFRAHLIQTGLRLTK